MASLPYDPVPAVQHLAHEATPRKRDAVLRPWWSSAIVVLVAIAMLPWRPVAAAQDDGEMWLEVLTRTEAYHDDGSPQGFLGGGLRLRIVDYDSDDEGTVWVAVRHPSGAVLWVVFDERVRQVLGPLTTTEAPPAPTATPQRVATAPDAVPSAPRLAPEPPPARPTPVIPAGPVPPQSPTSLIGSYDGATSITLRWADRSNNEQGFGIEVQTVGGSPVKTEAVGANATLAYVSGLSPNTYYCFYLWAYNEAGNSDRVGTCGSSPEWLRPPAYQAPTPCPRPSRDLILFVQALSRDQSTTRVTGTVTNNSGWSIDGLKVTAGSFGQAPMAQTHLSPGQSTSWQLRVGGLYDDIPSQVSWHWVPPAGCG